MSSDLPMPLPLARSRAQKLAEALEEVTKRVEIVGSIRRERREVGDLELLVEPRLGSPDLFDQDQGTPDTEAIRRALLEDAGVEKQMKGGRRYMQFELGGEVTKEIQGRKLDVFLVHAPASWGMQKVIRTGPWEYSRIVVTRIRERGWRVQDGAVWAPPGETMDQVPSLVREIEGLHLARVETPEEEDVFEAAKMSGVPPERRDVVLRRIQRARRDAQAGR